MGSEPGRPGDSRNHLSNTTRLRARLDAACHRALAEISAVLALLSSKATLSSLSSWVESRVPPAWRRPRRLLFVAAFLVVIVLILIGKSAAPPRRPPPGTAVFHVGNQVAIQFVHSTGSVHLSPGPGGQVSITAHPSGMTDAIHTRYRQRGNVVTVDVSAETGLPVATWVDFNVAVPQGANAHVTVPAGTVDASGLNGNLGLQDTAGSISASSLSGAIALQTTSGSISASRVSGQLSASTDNGTITTSSTRLSGHSIVRAQTGTINFHGSLDPGSHAEFRNTNGTIAVTLARGSSALVDASTPQGSINSALPGVRVGSDSDGRVARGRVGQDASAHLSIQTMGGSISLNHGS